MMPHGSPTIVLVSSSKDPASQNLARELVENQGFASTRIAFRGRALHQKDSLLLATIDEEIIRPPNLAQQARPLRGDRIGRGELEGQGCGESSCKRVTTEPARGAELG